MKSKKLIILSIVTGALVFGGTTYASVTGNLLSKADGNYKQWSTSAGTNNWSLVDESTCNGNTDYVRATTTGVRDSYKISISTVPNSAVISDIQLVPCASQNGTGGSTSTLDVFYRYNAVNSSDVGAYSLTGTTPVNLATTTFGSLSFFKTSTSTLEIGVVYTSGSNGARVSRLLAKVTYTPFNPPTALSGTATTTNAIGLTWTDNSTVEGGFNIQRKLSSSSTWTSIATTSANAVTYYDSGLSGATTYNHRVKAFNWVASTTWSTMSTTTTL